MSEEPDVDIEVRDFDASPGDRGPSGKDVVWKRRDGQSILSADEHDALDELIDEANERYDVDSLESGTVVAHIWLEDYDVDSLEWVLDEHQGE